MVRRPPNRFKTLNLSPSNLKRWKSKFLALRKRYQRDLPFLEAHEKARTEFLAPEAQARRGTPTKLDPPEHEQLLVLCRALDRADCRLTPLIVQSVAEGVVLAAGKGHTLKKHGGHIILEYEWARMILRYHLKWKKRKA